MTRALLIGLALLASAGSTWAGDPPPEKSPSPSAERRVPTEAFITQDLLTQDFANVEVAEVLRTIAEKCGINLVIAPGVKGRVSVSLKKRRPTGALEQVAALVGASVEELDFALYRVVPRAQVRLRTRRIVLQHWRPASKGAFAGDRDPIFRWAIDPLVRREGGSWRYVEEDHSVRCTTTRATGNIIETILRSLDTARK